MSGRDTYASRQADLQRERAVRMPAENMPLTRSDSVIEPSEAQKATTDSLNGAEEGL